MVSKSLKRSPTKSIKDPGSHRPRPRRLHRKKSPGKTTSSSIVSTINKTIFSCKRRLSKLFSKLARISTPNSRYKDYKILKTGSKYHDLECEKDTTCRALFFNERLPPLISHDKRTVFLDLDETLVHSKADPPPQKFDFVVRPEIEGEKMNFYVLKRPGVDAFLEALGTKYEVVVFTAGLKEYATLVLDRIDPKGVISHRLYRDSCKQVDGKFVKDLSEMGRDLKRVVIVDDNPNCYIYQPENAIPVKPFLDDLGDLELGKLATFFDRCDCFEDMRDAVKEYVGGEEDVEFFVIDYLTSERSVYCKEISFRKVLLTISNLDLCFSNYALPCYDFAFIPHLSEGKKSDLQLSKPCKTPLKIMNASPVKVQ
ncbi:hypothetical protein DKX38_005691 [Salix brachista]|uniref:FCP1 homology domain-containing protein n=1 Tax=Salix brachista TaxID=2182728 RepID=A0A5N5N074_9ROSI|nr:hypothetical protein DKX38_005691 [Salix brachista]